MRHLIQHCWRRGSYLSWETEDSCMTRVCITMGHTHTSLFLCAMFWTNIFQAAGLAVAHRHFRYHCHGHHVILTLPHPTILLGYYQGKSGCASLQQQQRRFAHNCGRRLSHNYSKNAPTYVTEDMEAHPSVCPAWRCTYGFTGHVTKACVSDSNQIMVAYWSVYGDFSPTLYIWH